MSFIVFMLCMIFALFFGAVLDRTILISKERNEENKEYEYFSLGFPLMEDAQEVLSLLKERLEINEGFVRVYDLYTYTSIKSEDPRDFNHGWKVLDDFRIENDGDSWMLRVPKPCLLEDDSKNNQAP